MMVWLRYAVIKYSALKLRKKANCAFELIKEGSMEQVFIICFEANNKYSFLPIKKSAHDSILKSTHKVRLKLTYRVNYLWLLIAVQFGRYSQGFNQWEWAEASRFSHTNLKKKKYRKTSGFCWLLLTGRMPLKALARNPAIRLLASTLSFGIHPPRPSSVMLT